MKFLLPAFVGLTLLAGCAEFAGVQDWVVANVPVEFQCVGRAAAVDFAADHGVSLDPLLDQIGVEICAPGQTPDAVLVLEDGNVALQKAQ